MILLHQVYPFLQVAQAAWRSPVVEPWRERVAQRLASGEGPTLAAFRSYLTSKASPAPAQVRASVAHGCKVPHPCMSLALWH